MTDLKTDAEKAEEIKQWWKENGTSVILGVALAIGSVFGWQQWQAYQFRQAEQASALFSQALHQNDKTPLETLKKDFSSSSYASFAALNTAKQASLTDNPQQAKEELEWVIEHSDDTLLKQLATLRLARINISTGDIETALSSLSGSFSSAYSPLVAELKGDAFLAQHKPAEASKAYHKAIQLSAGNPPQYLQLKLDNISSASHSSSSDSAGNEGA